MSDKDAGTPRVFIARHGETEWTKNGRYTGITELPLTPTGELQVRSTGRLVVGPNKLIDPARLAHIFISPRQRAQRTYELLLAPTHRAALTASARVTTTPALAEWDYGAYEGLLTHEIRARRRAAGFDDAAAGGRPWDIWRDGCEEGESPAQVAQRLDELIERIRAIQAPHMRGGPGGEPADVLLVAHGHLLRAFTKRWLRYDLAVPVSMMMEPGAVGVLSYQHHNVEEPAFMLGMALPPPSPEEEEGEKEK